MKPGTQRWRRMLRGMRAYYRKRDPWDFVARDKQMGVHAEHGEKGKLRNAEREFIRREMEE